MKRKKKIRPKMVAAFIAFNIILAALIAPFALFWGPFDSLKVLAVGSVATSRHPQVVQAFLSDEEIGRIMHQNDGNGVDSIRAIVRGNTVSDPSSGITIEDIQGQNFKGKVMLIKDPKRIKVATTGQLGVTGERLSELVSKSGAVAGINAGGFYDPNGKGNGAFPDGLTVHKGEIVHNNVNDQPVNIVAFDNNGKLIIGPMKASELKQHNIQEAVTFWPNLVEDGKPMITGDGGWGVAPRTGIGQRADGTVILVVIDGRQPTWSIGATLSDLMNVFLDYEAVNAVNLDGGSSSELVYNDEIMNRLWNVFGERYIPTAFVVMPD